MSCFTVRKLIHFLALSFLALTSLLLITACEQKPEEAKQVVRHIKHMTVQSTATSQARTLAGIITPSLSTNLSFEVSGQITKLKFSVGDKVNKGDLLASLDPQSFRLNVDSAEGALKNAQARLADATKKYEQQKQLYEKKFTTKTNFDTALANLESAKSEVDIQQSSLKIRKRDLEKSILTAPFTGSISEKFVEVFEEITPATTIAVLHTIGNYEISVSLPETMINSVSLGDEVEVKLTIGKASTLKGFIKEISSQAGQANAFPLTIALSQSNNKQVLGTLRPGMSAEVTFKFDERLEGNQYNVPTSAVLTAGEKGKGLVYVFNKEKNQVEKRSVHILNIRDNDLIITGELKDGDVIAIAGVSFLHDQMPVRLLSKQ